MMMTQPPIRPNHHRPGLKTLPVTKLYLILLFSLWPLSSWAAPPPDARPPSESFPESVRFDIRGHEVTGVYPIGLPLTLSVQLTGRLPSKGNVVAIFESPGYPMRLVPMGPESSRSARSALVTFEPLRLGSSSPPPKALRIDVTFAHIQGMHLHRFQRRTLYLTLGTPALPDPPHSGQASGMVPLPDKGITGSIVRANTEPLEDGKILEEDLLAASPVVRGNSYWEDIDSRIRRNWKQRHSQHGRIQATTSPTVHFRIYPNGEAQLIQVERSSRDFWVDLAALEAVVEAHPFPPFPPELSDPHLDVHVELLLPKR